jgi:hypothetical protein
MLSIRYITDISYTEALVALRARALPWRYMQYRRAAWREEGGSAAPGSRGARAFRVLDLCAAPGSKATQAQPAATAARCALRPGSEDPCARVEARARRVR